MSARFTIFGIGMKKATLVLLSLLFIASTNAFAQKKYYGGRAASSNRSARGKFGGTKSGRGMGSHSRGGSGGGLLTHHGGPRFVSSQYGKQGHKATKIMH